ncbi:hypothetical protein RFI_25316 [Reticulomyxa filosa]|uniref:Uncharacterized protein n=1 Tax=Reticulomyxa filosa TaxID=46433 RepID=X6MG79_RETFI|nr:hypothetical protein RFI_25316 [Reticulomyxa filosa]|eukprot:ETO12060.1 hypothetical protein RFI_25316 [Reticulomyxa filosa]
MNFTFTKYNVLLLNVKKFHANATLPLKLIKVRGKNWGKKDMSAFIEKDKNAQYFLAWLDNTKVKSFVKQIQAVESSVEEWLLKDKWEFHKSVDNYQTYKGESVNFEIRVFKIWDETVRMYAWKVDAIIPEKNAQSVIDYYTEPKKRMEIETDTIESMRNINVFSTQALNTNASKDKATAKAIDVSDAECRITVVKLKGIDIGKVGLISPRIVIGTAAISQRHSMCP